MIVDDQSPLKYDDISVVNPPSVITPQSHSISLVPVSPIFFLLKTLVANFTTG